MVFTVTLCALYWSFAIVCKVRGGCTVLEADAMVLQVSFALLYPLHPEAMTHPQRMFIVDQAVLLRASLLMAASVLGEV